MSFPVTAYLVTQHTDYHDSGFEDMGTKHDLIGAYLKEADAKEMAEHIKNNFAPYHDEDGDYLYYATYVTVKKIPLHA